MGRQSGNGNMRVEGFNGRVPQGAGEEAGGGEKVN